MRFGCLLDDACSVSDIMCDCGGELAAVELQGIFNFCADVMGFAALLHAYWFLLLILVLVNVDS